MNYLESDGDIWFGYTKNWVCLTYSEYSEEPFPFISIEDLDLTQPVHMYVYKHYVEIREHVKELWLKRSL